MADSTIQMTTTVTGASFTAADVLGQVVQELVASLQQPSQRDFTAALGAMITGVAGPAVQQQVDAATALMNANSLWPIYDRNGYLVRTGSLVEAMQNAFLLLMGRDSVTVLQPPIPAPDGSTSTQLGAPPAATSAAST